jgi:hypothetical protein
MRQRNITRAQIEEIVSNPERTRPGRRGVIEYDSTVDGRPLCAVVVEGSEPPLVVTIMIRE